MMDNEKRYEYILEPAEISEFCRKALVEQIKCRKKKWLFLALILLADAFIIPEAAGIVLLMLVVMYLVIGVRNYAVVKKTVAGQTWTVWMEDGRLKASRGNYSEVPCKNIQLIRITPRLLMLGYMQMPQRPVWFVIPRRVFAEEREQEAFLARLRSAQKAPAAPATAADLSGYTEDVFRETEGQDRAEDRTGRESVEQEGLTFDFFLDEEKWVRFCKGALDLINGGTFGRKERLAALAFWGCLTAVVMTVCVSFAAGGFHWLAAGFGLAVTVLMLLRLWFRDPEKYLRKQMKNPAMRDKECGPWRILLTEDGISVSMPVGAKDFYAWESLGWLVETEEVFYLFHKDKKRFLMIAKESFISWDQVGAFHQLCAAKGIRQAAAKKMHYIADWVWMPLCVLFLFVCVGVFVASVFLGAQSDRSQSITSDRGGFQEVRYPDYVSLDRQVEVLESLGLHVPVETVDSLREFMAEYDLQYEVEGSPYTWLLQDMGMPDYDEEGSLTAYSAEVFWFDFEGFDISTDYIDVLNGMAALAVGSCIDGVSGISEDTDGVDWEQGRGTVTVSLIWNGERYQWDMDVYYDWIDSKVLGIYNTLLEKENSDKFFYATGDNGQGAVVFFCTPQWAEEFMTKTGLVLEKD